MKKKRLPYLCENGFHLETLFRAVSSLYPFFFVALQKKDTSRLAEFLYSHPVLRHPDLFLSLDVSSKACPSIKCSRDVSGLWT